MMAALPPERVEISRPFTYTGLDFAGPFDIKSYFGRACRVSKGYACIFVCFSTKAIHLEATSDLSTQAFLAAFARFVSRRGCPLHLHSDNGTTFVGASRILAREFIQTSHERLLADYAHQNISWHFIPAGAPHMGGLWEAGVKSFKAHFRRVTSCYKYTFEEFCTLLSRIESCLNSRPISPMTTNPSDLNVLTPGHFLIGGPILTPVDPQVADTRISLVNRWQKLKVIYQTFCSRWKHEYLKELHKRNKWQKPEENLQEGALVILIFIFLFQTIMPKISSISTSSRSKRSFNCRICKRPHPLRTCKKFLKMKSTDRIRAVRKHGYCPNCLAHNHSQKTCFSKHGCKKCKKFHHTLLHIQPKLCKKLVPSTTASPSRSSSPQPSTSTIKHTKTSPVKSRSHSPPSKSASLTAILRQNTIVLLPTVLVKIGATTSHARCLLDSASPISRVSKKLIDNLDLTAYTLRDETMCPITLKSRFDSSSKIDGTFRVDNRILLRTPTQSLPESYKRNFRDLFLADSKFYEKSGVDIILGADLYPKVILQGVFSRTGFPTAQSTIFGWTIYGPCSL